MIEKKMHPTQGCIRLLLFSACLKLVVFSLEKMLTKHYTFILFVYSLILKLFYFSLQLTKKEGANLRFIL